MSNQITRRGLLCLFTFACLLLTNTEVNGQIQKGFFQAGGSVSYFNNNQETTSALSNPTTQTSENSNWGFVPNVGYFISDNFSLGLQLGFSSHNVKTNEIEGNGSAFQYGVYGRWYKPISDKFYFFNALSLVLANGTSDALDVSSGQETKMDMSSFSANVSPGLTYFMTDWLALDTSINLLSYTSTKSETENNNFSRKSDAFNFNLNLTSLNFGLMFYF